MELQSLDQQLKVAIQNHQILVAKMKSDPQNGNLQKTLHDLQSRIRSLSERQKQMVEQLRKDIEIKKQQASSGSDGANNNNNHPAATVVSKGGLNFSQVNPPSTTTTTTTIVNSIPQQVMPLSLTMKQVDSSRFTTILLPAKVTLSPATCIGGTSNGSEAKTQLVTLTTTLLPPNTAPTAIIYRPSPPSATISNTTQTLNSSSHLPPPPPPTIRVPHYPPLRLPSTSPTSHPTSTNSNANATVDATSNTIVSTSNNKTTAHHHRYHPYSSQSVKVSNKNSHHADKDVVKPLDPDQQKNKFMLSLGLVTHEVMSEMKNRKSERKRRTTANPQFSYGNWDNHPEKKTNTHYLTSTLPPGFKRPRGRPRLGSTTPSGSRPTTPEDHLTNGSSDALMKVLQNGLLSKDENVCVMCRTDKGDLLGCSVCLLNYHSSCLQLTTDEINNAQQKWECPNCVLIKKKGNQWPRSLAVVHSYILRKTAKEEEKRKLLKRGEELKQEQSDLEQRSKQMSEELSARVKTKTEVLLDTKMTLESIEQLKSSIRLLQTS
ncbi:PHD finger protein 21A [Chamberlinius hualienensis]